MTRFIDGAKKQRGLVNDTTSGLKLDLESLAPTAGALR